MCFLKVSTLVSQFEVDLAIQVDLAEWAPNEKEKDWKVTNKDLLWRVELLSREKAENEEEHVMDIKEVITVVKANDVVDILEEKIKLTEDVANAGS